MAIPKTYTKESLITKDNSIKLFFILLNLIFITGMNAQVLNVDRENGQDSIKKKVMASVAFSFSSDKQKNDYIEFSNKNEFDYFLKNNYLFLLINEADISYSGTKAIENNGYAQLRFRDNDTRKIAPDAYCQFQWNGILGMERRSLAGINARFLCVEKNKSDLYFSAGTFYEIEKWNSGLSSYNYQTDKKIVVNREMFRLNLVVKSAFKIGSKIDFVETSYLQFPMNSNFLKPRWTFDSNLYFEITKHVNFLIHYDHSFDEYRPLPIDAFYYSVNLGVQIKI